MGRELPTESAHEQPGALQAANLGLRFLLELAALAALAYWGSQATGSTGFNVLLAIAAPGIAAAFWGLLLAPKASRRLDEPARGIGEFAVFALAAVALAGAGAQVLALAFFALALVNGAWLRVSPGSRRKTTQR